MSVGVQALACANHTKQVFVSQPTLIADDVTKWNLVTRNRQGQVRFFCRVGEVYVTDRVRAHSMVGSASYA
jgi:hypothetical protein